MTLSIPLPYTIRIRLPVLYHEVLIQSNIDVQTIKSRYRNGVSKIGFDISRHVFRNHTFRLSMDIWNKLADLGYHGKDLQDYEVDKHVVDISESEVLQLYLFTVLKGYPEFVYRALVVDVLEVEI